MNKAVFFNSLEMNIYEDYYSVGLKIFVKLVLTVDGSQLHWKETNRNKRNHSDESLLSLFF